MPAANASVLPPCLLLLAAGNLTAADAGSARGWAQAGDAKPRASAPAEANLPKDVMGFQGKVSGTVVSVDAEKAVLRVKVTKAEAHAERNKAPKPEALAGMTISVTPLDVKPPEGPSRPDEKAAAYIKGAKAGDPVTLEVRASSKGVVFRLLKVPSAGGK